MAISLTAIADLDNFQKIEVYFNQPHYKYVNAKRV